MSQVIYLSSSGDSFECKFSGYKVINFETDKVHPALKLAAKCKTREAVLAFLDHVKNDQSFLQCVKLYHDHNFWHAEHYSIKGAAHEESLEEMQAFVEMKITYSRALKITLYVLIILGACALFSTGFLFKTVALKITLFAAGGISCAATIASLILEIKKWNKPKEIL